MSVRERGTPYQKPAESVEKMVQKMAENLLKRVVNRRKRLDGSSGDVTAKKNWTPDQVKFAVDELQKLERDVREGSLLSSGNVNRVQRWKSRLDSLDADVARFGALQKSLE